MSGEKFVDQIFMADDEGMVPLSQSLDQQPNQARLPDDSLQRYNHVQSPEHVVALLVLDKRIAARVEAIARSHRVEQSDGMAKELVELIKLRDSRAHLPCQICAQVFMP